MTSILGSLRSEDGNGVVRMEDRYDTDIDDLWSALTDPARLARWYGEVEGDLRLGGELQVRIPDAGQRTGRVDACKPPRRLLVTMHDPDAASTCAFGRYLAGGESEWKARWQELTPAYQSLGVSRSST